MYKAGSPGPQCRQDHSAYEVLPQLRSAWAHLPPAGTTPPAAEKGDLLMPLGHKPPSSCLTGQKRSPGPDRGLQKSEERPQLWTHWQHSPATAQEQPADSRESSWALRSTSWTQPPPPPPTRPRGWERPFAVCGLGRGSGLCLEVPVSRRHCGRTGGSPCARPPGPALLPRAGPGTGTGGRQPRSATLLLFVYQAGHAAGLLSPQPRSLPASRPAGDKGACGGLAARRAGPRFPRRQLLARLAKAAVVSRPRSLRAERGPGGTPPVFICKADPVPAPSGRPGQAGAAGSAADNGRARARPPDSGPLLQEPRADGLMGQKRSVKGDRSGL